MPPWVCVWSFSCSSSEKNRVDLWGGWQGRQERWSWVYLCSPVRLQQVLRANISNYAKPSHYTPASFSTMTRAVCICMPLQPSLLCESFVLLNNLLRFSFPKLQNTHFLNYSLCFGFMCPRLKISICETSAPSPTQWRWMESHVWCSHRVLVTMNNPQTLFVSIHFHHLLQKRLN